MERRTRLMRVVTRRIALSELGNREIARRAGVPSQRISDLLAGRLEHFSAEELKAIRDSMPAVAEDIDDPLQPTPP
ncbi:MULTISPECIES: XRE family transcriptional regulator [Modicisalibacter]|nr:MULTISPECIES: XRE family transcriptional regulator [Modicisalibacter]KXS37583.1 MAG: hypothetical protein AWU55_2213 [Halomonadaceae bacterium T82-2]